MRDNALRKHTGRARALIGIFDRQMRSTVSRRFLSTSFEERLWQILYLMEPEGKQIARIVPKMLFVPLAMRHTRRRQPKRIVETQDPEMGPNNQGSGVKTPQIRSRFVHFYCFYTSSFSRLLNGTASMGYIRRGEPELGERQWVEWDDL